MSDPEQENPEREPQAHQEQSEHIVKTAMRYAVSKSPGFAAIALWCPYIVTSGDFIAMTNGRSIRFGAGFFAYAPLEQVAIVVHEILHVALRHIPRAQKGRREPLLWNICTDAVINETLAEMSWLTVPSDAVRMSLLLTEQELRQIPANQWTSEALYEHLLQHRERLTDLLARFGMDLEPAGGPAEPLEEQIWNHRLRRARAGDLPGGLLREIGHDFPVETIPWERVLRRLMTQPLLPQTRVNWSRPSRRSLALGTEFFEPGNRPQDGLQMAGIVIDTSGSIDKDLLTRFAQEIQAVQRRTGCDVYLISADAAVQTEQKVRNDGRSLRQKIEAGQVQIKGGGGTDFYPALQRMKEQQVRVVIYLTDLYGNFGPETKYPFPVIWASTSKGEKAPFGVTLYLE